MAAADHPFTQRPHRTLLVLSVPVLFSMIAEPLTGLVDTAFVARLGAAPLAALGAGATALSSIFWVFNFLQIGTQTEVANHFGAGRRQAAADATGLALVLSALIGVLLALLVLPLAPWIARGMGAGGALEADAVTYMRLRALGAPAILLMLAAFGALRGVQAMQTPLAVAVTVNLLNILLDALLIFGLGPFPALGIAGAALATTISQWIGAIWATAAVLRRLGRPGQIALGAAGKLLVVGGDLFVRTGLLTGFLILSTRAATQIGADAGAAHQAIRQVWLFTALFLDAFAVTGQSLVGYFFGAQLAQPARRVAALTCGWSLAVGVLLGMVMLLGRVPRETVLVPLSAQGRYDAAWVIAAVALLINALAFATDGVHWGTGDYRYLRNAMIVATGIAGILVLLVDVRDPAALTHLWVITALWGALRAGLGLARIWPGIGAAPLRHVGAGR
jgi:MATE family multidrug resistance protein